MSKGNGPSRDSSGQQLVLSRPFLFWYFVTLGPCRNPVKHLKSFLLLIGQQSILSKKRKKKDHAFTVKRMSGLLLEIGHQSTNCPCTALSTPWGGWKGSGGNGDRAAAVSCPPHPPTQSCAPLEYAQHPPPNPAPLEYARSLARSRGSHDTRQIRRYARGRQERHPARESEPPAPQSHRVSLPRTRRMLCTEGFSTDDLTCMSLQ